MSGSGKLPYYVWRREPDGYVDASHGRMPIGWTQPVDGVKVTFVELGRFYDWQAAYDCVVENRLLGKFTKLMGPFA